MTKQFKKKFTLKEKIFAHIEIWRPYTILWCGLVSLAGSCITNLGLPPIKTAILVTIIPIIGWISGLYLIDFIDRKLDVIQKPHRPIPSGRIKREEALFIGAFLVTLGILLTILLNLINLFLVIIVAALVYSYAKFTKSRGVIGNLNRGSVTVAAFVFGVFSINLPLNMIPIFIWYFSIVFLIHDTNSNMIGAIRDIEGDKKGGYITLPVKYGVKNTGFLSIFLTILWFSLTIIIAIYSQFFKIEFFMVIVLDFLIIIYFYIYFFNSLKNYSRRKALNFHKILVIERIVLVSAFIFGTVDLYIALFIFVLALFITIVSQNILRDQYEFKEI